MTTNLSNAIRTAAASVILGLTSATLFAVPASAHYLTTRCDRDGDRCWVIRCDDDGDDCRTVREYGPDYDRWGYRGSGHWACDSDGDRCQWVQPRICDGDGDECRPAYRPYDRDRNGYGFSFDWRN